MVKIRLMRMGAKRNPHYRLVVVDSRQKRDSSYLEQIGYYDPRETSAEPVKIDTERATHWLSRGAQPSDTAVRILEKAGVEVPGVRAKRSDAYVKRARAES